MFFGVWLWCLWVLALPANALSRRQDLCGSTMDQHTKSDGFLPNFVLHSGDAFARFFEHSAAPVACDFGSGL